MRVRRWIRNDGGNDRRAFRGLIQVKRVRREGEGSLALRFQILRLGAVGLSSAAAGRDGC